MGKIGNLITGDGIDTIFSAQSQCEEYLVIGGPDTENVIESISIEIDGTSFINIKNNISLIGTWQKWMMQNAAADGIAQGMFKIATGIIKRPTTITLTNSGVTTPEIFTFSDSKNGIPFLVAQTNINASSYSDFERFSALMFDSNDLDYAEIVFADGHKAKLTAVELDSLFVLKNQSDGGGQLGGNTVIDNTDQSIMQVRLYTLSAGTMTVLVVKIPDAAFNAIRSAQ